MRTIAQLCRSLDDVKLIGNTEIPIQNITFDSRKVTAETPNTLYIAQKGTQVDGHRFIEQSVQAGAVAILCEDLPELIHPEVTYIQVPNSSVALGRVASTFYGNPSKKLKLVGITGTNGKTTTVTLLHQLFFSLGYPVGLLSTIVHKINDKEIHSTHTTPDALQLNALMHQMVEAGCEYCFMEVSSHAIVQSRIEGLHFTGAIFSNITHDHLDFHETFRNYIDAKKKFFDDLPKGSFALTNIDDKNGLVMLQNTKAEQYSYSLMKMADFKGKVIENSFEGLHCAFNDQEVYLKICGKFNAYNMLAIYATASLLGIQNDELLVAMSVLDNAMGRFQVLRNEKRQVAIVDYAHTPDALQNVLSTIKDITENSVEVITVVGCGGDRDRLKRPVMAEVACQLSNKVIITSDNPRTEDPGLIIADMMEGIPVERRQNVFAIENRREAIKVATTLLPEGGVVLVAGKGHENYQEINHLKHHFDDVEELRNCQFL